MQFNIRTMGKSNRVPVTKPILAQTGLVDVDVLQVHHSVRKTPPLKRNLREGWAAGSLRVTQSADDGLAWPAFANATDAALKW